MAVNGPLVIGHADKAARSVQLHFCATSAQAILKNPGVEIL
jgi:hypothetical protein